MSDIQQILSGELAPDSSLVSDAAAESGGVEVPGTAIPEPSESRNVTTSVVPAGFSISYCPDPREYRIDDVVVPSVTTVLDVLRKDALTWWGMKVGLVGAATLLDKSRFQDFQTVTLSDLDDKNHPLLRLMKDYRLTTNHVRDHAANRGTSVHRGLEIWAVTGQLPEEEDYPEEERGYIRGLRAFLADCKNNLRSHESELMVGSKEHGFAGRFDLMAEVFSSNGTTLELKTGPRTTRHIPAGLGIFDLKTSKGIYDSHMLQLSAYRLGLEESGYGRSDFECVIQVSNEGRYDVKLNPKRPDHFLAVLQTWRALR